jgi:hypothetical protein
MRNSISQFKHFFRVAFLVLPVLLLLGLNGRTVNLLRPVGLPPQSWMSAPPRATVIKQKVMLEAASPLGAYVAPAIALGWLPDALPTTWLPRFLRNTVAAAPLLHANTTVALLCQLRLLRVALSPQAP